MSDEQRVVTLDVGPLRRPFHEQLHGQGLKKAHSTPLLEQAADAIYLLLTASLLSPEAGGPCARKAGQAGSLRQPTRTPRAAVSSPAGVWGRPSRGERAERLDRVNPTHKQA